MIITKPCLDDVLSDDELLQIARESIRFERVGLEIVNGYDIIRLCRYAISANNSKDLP